MKHLLIICLVCISLGAFAGKGSGKEKLKSVSGQIIDAKSKEGLAGVLVSIEGTSYSTYTDFDGNFSFPAAPNGVLKIKTEMVSYHTSTEELTLNGRKKTSLKEPIKVYPVL